MMGDYENLSIDSDDASSNNGSDLMSSSLGLARLLMAVTTSEKVAFCD